jgi:hypothetical protein
MDKTQFVIIEDNRTKHIYTCQLINTITGEYIYKFVSV